jgi:hypothetical protein
MKLWRLPKAEASILKHRVPSLWLTYIGERRTTFAKAYGVKVRCYWECFEEHVRNLGTLCFDPPPQEKKERSLHSMTRLLIGCIEILILKLAPLFLASWTNGPSEEHPTYSEHT